MSTGLVAVQGTELDTLGAIVWWRVRGELDREALAGAWHGLKPEWLPPEPGRRVAVHRAVKEERGASVLLRPVRDGWAVVDEVLDERTNRPRHTVRCTYTLDRCLRLKRDETVLGSDDPVEEKARWYETHLITQDVSTWLTRTMDRLDASPLRETGGVYFVPAYSMDQLKRIVDALNSEGNTVTLYHVPAVREENAAQAFLEAVARRISSEVERIQREMQDDSMGVRALETRVSEAKALESTLSKYEQLLGAKLDTVSTQLTDLRTELLSAIATVDATEAAQ